MTKIDIEPELVTRLEDVVARSDGILPVSVGSLVHIAVEAFLDGTDGK